MAVAIAAANWVASQPAIARENAVPGVRERELAFQSQGIRLEGSLLLPSLSGMSAAVVLLPGSGPEPRTALRTFAERFARAGVATLAFDKRGTGKSGGSWLTASLDDLAEDALAAATALKAQPEVDKRRVGVWGISQSGWVIPRAVAKSPNAFAFAILITGGGVRPREVERFDYQRALDRIGADPNEQSEAMSLVEKYFSYLHGTVARADLEKAVALARSKRWFAGVDVTRVMPDDASREKWSWVADYDPLPDMIRMRMPTLIALGEKDRPDLTAKAEAQWRASLAQAGNQDAVVALFLGAGHGITTGSSHDAHKPAFEAGYLEMVEGWLIAHAMPK